MQIFLTSTIPLAVTLVVAGTIIVVQLISSMTGMYEVAKLPHFLQMDKGELDGYFK